MRPVKFWAAAFLAAGLLWAAVSPAGAAAPERQRLVYWPGTAREVEVYRIQGREPGPTVMILGGIQGDEPGGFLSADLFADVSLKRGNLIVVPRANPLSIAQASRGVGGDMNRKFQGDLAGDPDREIVSLLKSLIGESDLLLNLHDGSGYYRPTYESELANPKRYGQSIIADAEVYTHEPTGRVIHLASHAREVIERINREIPEPLHLFRFFNTNTGAADSPYKEQRRSASYYALTQAGIPAFGIETSKQLPSLEMKVSQHNLAVAAFLDLFGVEMDQPSLSLPPPRLGYVVLAVGGHPPLAVADGQTLLVAPGETVTVADVAANYDRGLSVSFDGEAGWNDWGRPRRLTRPATLTIQKDFSRIGRIKIDFLTPEQAGGPPRLLEAAVPIRSVRAGTPAVWPPAGSPPEGDAAPGAGPEKTASAGDAAPANLPAAPPGPASSGPGQAGQGQAGPGQAGPGQVTGFLLEVDGRAAALAPGQSLAVAAGALVKLVDLRTDGPLPPGVVMNLRGFVPKGKAAGNDGEDRGKTADTGADMMASFSLGGRGRDYSINAEQGKKILAAAQLRITRPRLESVTFVALGRRQTLKLGGRAVLPPGTPITVTEIKLDGGLTLGRPRYTLGGRAVPETAAPLNLTQPSFAANLAVFNGEFLAGKVTFAPSR